NERPGAGAVRADHAGHLRLAEGRGIEAINWGVFPSNPERRYPAIASAPLPMTALLPIGPAVRTAWCGPAGALLRACPPPVDNAADSCRRCAPTGRRCNARCRVVAIQIAAEMSFPPCILARSGVSVRDAVVDHASASRL